MYTIEIVPELARSAAALLAELGYANVTVRQGDGYRGWAGRAPFDRIILTAAPPEVPQALLDQLARGGRLVAGTVCQCGIGFRSARARGPAGSAGGQCIAGTRPGCDRQDSQRRHSQAHGKRRAICPHGAWAGRKAVEHGTLDPSPATIQYVRVDHRGLDVLLFCWGWSCW